MDQYINVVYSNGDHHIDITITSPIISPNHPLTLPNAVAATLDMAIRTVIDPIDIAIED